MSDDSAGHPTRRTALKVLAAGAAVAATPPLAGCGRPDEVGTGAAGDPGATGGPGAGVAPVGAPRSNPLARGTPTDPDLIAPTVPWPMVLTEAEMLTVAALADVIIPADARSPSASQVGAHHYVNEYVSAPYPAQERDRVLVRGGLVWLDTESRSRFERPFRELGDSEARQICDLIHHRPDALPEHQAAARFFDLMRDLVATAFWTTDEGMADLGYIGNVPTASFDGPPPEVLQQLGLA